jgi:hypothetical protein
VTREEIIAAVQADKSLAGANLQKASLYKADLRGADFQGANLQKASLQGADLREANFQKANLYEADFYRASLQKANLQGADLQEADLRGADLREANFQKANLYEANLRRANLRRANLREASLQGADLREANFQKANLYEADLFFMYAYDAKTAGIKLSWIPKKGDLVRVYPGYSNPDESVLGVLLEDPDPDHLFNPVSVRLRDKVARSSITYMKPASRLEEIVQEEVSLLFEGKLERETTILARVLLQAIKQFYQKEPGKSFFRIMWLPEELRALGIDLPKMGVFNFAFFVEEKSDLEVKGMYRPQAGGVTVLVNVPRAWRYINAHLNDILVKLKEVIRHELEHTTQSPKMLYAASNISKTKGLLPYLSSSAELRAWTSGLYKRAKVQRRPLKDVFDEFFHHVYIGFVNRMSAMRDDLSFVEIDKIAMRDVRKLRRRWEKYVRGRYPGAQL